uniref:Uncharacterized protein n=1 Tax=viral metagenome TaxID=1070528 RepID=A0A6C0KM29_9ZZZZ
MIILEIKFLNYHNLGNRGLEEMVRKSGVGLMLYFGHPGKLTILFFRGFLFGFPKL